MFLKEKVIFKRLQDECQIEWRTHYGNTQC